MSHDRARLSALVDGELDHEARERVLAHLAQCDECRAVVETERRVKSLLSGMPEASPGGDFLARLNNLADPNAEPAAPPPTARARRRPLRRGRPGGQLMRTSSGTAHPSLGPHGHAQPPSPPTPGTFGNSQSSSRPSLGAHGDPQSPSLEVFGDPQSPSQPSLGAHGDPQSPSFEVFGDSPSLAGALAASAAVPFTGVQRTGRRTMRHPLGGSSRPAANRPFGHPDSRPDTRRPGRFRSGGFGRRFTVGVAGAASLAGMALVTAFTVGGTTAPTTADLKVVPPVERYTVQHADTAVELPFTDPGAPAATIGDANLTGLLSTNR